MPHDRDGKLLEVGDFVYIPCVVLNIQSGTDYCNVSLESIEPMFPSDSKSSFALNAKQVEKK